MIYNRNKHDAHPTYFFTIYKEKKCDFNYNKEIIYEKINKYSNNTYIPVIIKII